MLSAPWFQVRVWAREEVREQTTHSLELAIKLYEFYTNYFQMSEVVSKAGLLDTIIFHMLIYCMGILHRGSVDLAF